jgi:CMP/dCMP kinase
MKPPLVIAIDGPAGAGKSTAARGVARQLGLAYVDSGATYRAAALGVLEAGISTEDEPAIAAVIASAEISVATEETDCRVLLDGCDVTAKIRTPEVTRMASKISQLPQVREKLVSLQRRLATAPGVVMEGRDIGTVVFPEAPLKIFLVADPAERARRRLGQEKESGRSVNLEETEQEITRRDRLDSERKLAPLTPAADAIELDSTDLTIDEVIEYIVELARERGLVESTHTGMPGSGTS